MTKAYMNLELIFFKHKLQFKYTYLQQQQHGQVTLVNNTGQWI